MILFALAFAFVTSCLSSIFNSEEEANRCAFGISSFSKASFAFSKSANPILCSATSSLLLAKVVCFLAFFSFLLASPHFQALTPPRADIATNDPLTAKNFLRFKVSSLFILRCTYANSSLSLSLSLYSFAFCSCNPVRSGISFFSKPPQPLIEKAS